ncbi:hypothetical protein [Pseudomonas chlororaphis]|jgi:hypothetical protein|uniref:hypothetical protein n=1 Tax=Pseudomonas chlororaphis TaxID=587753 RepID=UPI002365328E|nr:hypothetical protein [Pseudomonas chlororaphis]WDG53764.1 hypothetical protein PUP76_28525 [Pseudomonas chlororaphis]WDH91035.1 hypothetical protein PUP74_13660 [Pseudomonas chlororaphis]
MIRIRSEQMAIFEHARQQEFCAKAVAFLHSEHSPRCAERGHAEVALLVERYTPRLVAHGITSPVQTVTVLETLLLSRLDLRNQADADAVDAAFAQAGHSFDSLNDRLGDALAPDSRG